MVQSPFKKQKQAQFLKKIKKLFQGLPCNSVKSFLYQNHAKFPLKKKKVEKREKENMKNKEEEFFFIIIIVLW